MLHCGETLGFSSLFPSKQNDSQVSMMPWFFFCGVQMGWRYSSYNEKKIMKRKYILIQLYSPRDGITKQILLNVFRRLARGCGGSKRPSSKCGKKCDKLKEFHRKNFRAVGWAPFPEKNGAGPRFTCNPGHARASSSSHNLHLLSYVLSIQYLLFMRHQPFPSSTA